MTTKLAFSPWPSLLDSSVFIGSAGSAMITFVAPKRLSFKFFCGRDG